MDYARNFPAMAVRMAITASVAFAILTLAARPAAADDAANVFRVQVSDSRDGETSRHEVRCNLDRLPCVQVLNNGDAAQAGRDFALLHVLNSEKAGDRVKVIVSYDNAAFGQGQEVAIYSRQALVAGLSIRMTAKANRPVEIAKLASFKE